MHFELIQSSKAFEAVASEWNGLLEVSASHVPFLRHEYLTTWWQTLGGGEWKGGELCVVLTRQGDGTLIGAAPLFFTQNRDSTPALMLLGSIEISDYLDILASPAELEPFLRALLPRLAENDLPDWQVLDWCNILESSPTLAILQQVSHDLGWQHSQESLQQCPYIPLPGDWDTYLAGIDKKQRHEIRRKIRRAESFEEPVRWYIVENADQLESEIEAFLVLMGQDEEKQAFLTDIMRTQMKAAVTAAFQAGWLQLAFLEVSGRKAAGYLNFDFGDHIWVYNSGLDYSFSQLSPGWVLLGYLLRWANENKRKAFDFMRGGEDYKYRFGALDRHVMRVKIQRNARSE